MYGKHFESMYTGSMYGKGSMMFAVWGYVISRRRGNIVEINPKELADILGEPVEQIEQTIEMLCSPDPSSRSQTKQGRRLERVGQFLYQVVNAEEYDKMANDHDRIQYQREWDREHRPSGHKRSKKGSPTQSNTVRQCPTQSDPSDSDSDLDSDSNTIITPLPPKGGVVGFDEFWKIYPRKTAKQNARKAWAKLKPSEELRERILAAVYTQRKSDQWLKNDGQYIPHPATWLNQERWTDEVQEIAPDGLPEKTRLEEIHEICEEGRKRDEQQRN